MKKSFSHIHMPTFICGRGSISFVRTLNKERVAVVGYSDVVKEIEQIGRASCRERV